MKIALIGINGHFSRNWVHGGGISKLSKLVDLESFVMGWGHGGLKSNDYSGICSLDYLLAKRVRYICKAIQALTAVVYRKASPTFGFRIERFLLGDELWFPVSRGGVRRVTHVFLQFKKLFQRMKRNRGIFIALLIPGKKIILKLLILSLKIEAKKDLPSGLIEANLIIISSGGNESELPFLLQTLDRPTLLLTENWDNLTSKTFLAVKPNYISAPGARYGKWVCEAWGFDSSNVLLMAPPRISEVNRASKQLIDLIESRQQLRKSLSVVYAGNSVPHEDRELMKFLVTSLETEITSGILKISYRPHPGTFRVFSDLHSLIHLDWEHCKDLVGMLPRVNQYYLQELMEPDIMICSPTSVAIERVAAQRKCLVDLTNDQKHRTSPGYAAAKWFHWADMNEANGFIVCYDKESLLGEIQNEIRLKVNLESVINRPKFHTFHVSDLHYTEEIVAFAQLVSRHPLKR